MHVLISTPLSIGIQVTAFAWPELKDPLKRAAVISADRQRRRLTARNVSSVVWTLMRHSRLAISSASSETLRIAASHLQYIGFLGNTMIPTYTWWTGWFLHCGDPEPVHRGTLMCCWQIIRCATGLGLGWLGHQGRFFFFLWTFRTSTFVSHARWTTDIWNICHCRNTRKDRRWSTWCVSTSTCWRRTTLG